MVFRSLIVLCTFLVIYAPTARAEPDSDAFSSTVLLDRFDVNGNGKLEAEERRTLRSAFGDIDVPMLPPRPYQYTQVNSPAHVSAGSLRQMDDAPQTNPITDAGATLGRVLFYDTRLSRNNTIACASCHHQQHSFSDPRRLSVGYEGGVTGRNAMSLVNLRYTHLKGSRPGFFWDERAATLEDQVLMPIQDKIEMGMELPDLEKKLGQLPYYPALFRDAFGSPEVTSDRIAMAISQFMRALVSFDSKFDRAAGADGDYAKDFDQFSPQENLGKSLFINGVGRVAEIGCAHCHMPPTFGMPKSFNNGLDLEYRDQGLGARDVANNDPFTPNNNGKFKAPSLRNVELTSPYMHDGRFATLEQVIEHYSSGVHPHANLGLALDLEEDGVDKPAAGFHLTDAQQSALVAFLKTLTDATFVSDPRFSDPFVR